MDAIWVEMIAFFHIYVSIEFYFRINSSTCNETFKKFLEPIVKGYEEDDDDDSSLVTDISPSIA